MRAVLVVLGVGATAAVHAAPGASTGEQVEIREERGFVGLTTLVGTSDLWLFGGFMIEAGAAVPRSPVSLRARGFATLVGGTTQSDWGGDFMRFGGGMEIRSCDFDDTFCAFGSLDIGYQRLDMYDVNDNYRFVAERKGVVTGPRVGLDIGGRLRLRGAIEFYRHRTEGEWKGSSGLSLGLTYQF